MTVAMTAPNRLPNLDFLPDLDDPTDLRIPGPTPLPPDVIAAMTRPMVPHRGPSMKPLLRETLRLAREIHRTDGEVLLWSGTGSAGWEIAIVNHLQPGDSVLATVCGDFGDRFAKVGDRLGLDVHRLDVAWGEAITPDLLRPALEAHPEVKAVFLTHNETSTGVTNPIRDLARLVRDHGALTFVDAVSGAGALPLELDAWGLDVVLSGSQKAWMCPPGIVIVGFGARALEVSEAMAGRGFPRFTFDVTNARKAAADGVTPSTPPLSLLYAFRTALELIDQEGVENVWARHAAMGALTREAVTSMGLSLLADQCFASDAVTAVRSPAGVDAQTIQTRVRERSRIELAVGQGHLTNDLIRIGHLGWVHEPDLRRALEALKRAISHQPTATSRQP